MSLGICWTSSEVAPFAKTGGLGDVSAALPRYLHRVGHDVRIFLPFYSSIDNRGLDIVEVDFLRHLELDIGLHRTSFSVFTTPLPDSGLPVYLIHCPALYERSGIYAGGDDDAVRFSFLSRASLLCCQHMSWSPDIFHCNDWHTALMPLYLKRAFSWDQLFQNSRTVLTIHNIAYQGIFPERICDQVGLGEDREFLYQDDLDAGILSFLKTGILYADVLTTVSPTHALELQTDAYGMGLQDLLRQRSDHLVGILNGVDYGEWNPATDRVLEHHYSPDDLSGKQRTKLAVTERLGLDTDPRLPLLGVISRLTAQKGFDLVIEPMRQALGAGRIQLVALGTGESRYESAFQGLQDAFPGRAVFHRGYSEELAHLIEAAADIFVMPSKFEPSGLNQMYSLKYGTVPIVRRTGGLADAVDLYNPATGEGTGFLFDHFSIDAFRRALAFALETYADPEAWKRLMHNGMSRDFSWDRQGALYVELYRRLAGHS
ncbi:MAG: glycogen synthase [Acidobacteria bacterium]|nr:glycogen synthase [Acidobacteriota bacterium]